MKKSPGQEQDPAKSALGVKHPNRLNEVLP